MNAIVAAMMIQATLPIAPPSPPIVVTSTRSVMVPITRERTVLDVEVRAGGEVLWSGPMAVSSAQSSNFTRRLTEPAPEDCGPTNYGQQLDNSLTIQISPQRQNEGDTAFGVSVRWGRSIPGACPYRASSRSVELNQTVALAPGRQVVLSGDADLTVRLHRR